MPATSRFAKARRTLHPVVEEAAILFANGQDEAALATLEAAAAAGGLDTAANQVWAMLFDLYQLLGSREQFDKRALEYSMKYEKSPPTWVEPAKQSLGPALTTGGTAFVAFTGLLGESADKTVKQLEKIIAGHPVARVEFGKLQSVDTLGAEILLKAMRAARKRKCELVMSGPEKLVELLKGKIEVGKREDETLWMLLLELYQQMAQQDPFEEWAVNYAITFEVSPPSWESRPAAKKPVPAAASPDAGADPDVFPLAGEMYSAGSDAFRQLVDFATDRKQVLIDCSALKRMDFVSAGLFLNTLTNLQITGCSVTIRHPNQLIFALFGVLGINQVAHVEAAQVLTLSSIFLRFLSGSSMEQYHGTTILSVRRGARVALGGDGQVTLGNIVIKASARKVRRLYQEKILAGFAGGTADAFTLFERFEAKLEKHQGNLLRSAVELAKDWRTDRILRRLEAMLAVADRQTSLVITGNGDVLEPELGIVAIGSGGPYAQAAARALLENTELAPEEIVKKSLDRRRRPVHLHQPEPRHRGAGVRREAREVQAKPLIARTAHS